MGCNAPGATHHVACDCREAAVSADIARLTRERDEARERAAGLSHELLTAIQARDSYRASAELRVGMRREFEELLGCGDTTGEEAFERGLIRLRALVAAESRAARLLTVIKEIESKTGHFGEAPPPPEWMPMLSLIAWVGKTARAALGEEEE